MFTVRCQKLLFYDTAEGVSSFIRPHWEKSTVGRASVTQAVPGMLEILPEGASKGVGVKIMLDSLGLPYSEVIISRHFNNYLI